jgi:hypothetical protein
MRVTLEELAGWLNPGPVYADLPEKPRATREETAWFKAALIKLVASQTRAINV